MAAHISRIILFVADLPKVAVFFQQHFGPEAAGPAEDGWIELNAGGCNLALHHGKLPPGAAQHSPAKIVFAVSDVRAEVERLTLEGLKFGKVHDWNGFSLADTKDPEGNPIQLSSRGVAKA